jgi:Tfp pilus assembly protein PilW
MSRNFRSIVLTPHRARNRGEVGLTAIEVLAAFTIMVVVFGSIHLMLGNTIAAKLMISNRAAKQNQGRLVAEWIADRVRQAGYLASSSSSIARCRNGIVSQDSNYYPTTSSLSITADVNGDGTPETRTFKVETVNGVSAVTETVLNCTAGATSSDQPITDTTSVKVVSLTFAYTDASGTPVTNLTSPSAIQTIRNVQVSVKVHATAGQTVPTAQTWNTEQTWTTQVALRNP